MLGARQVGLKLLELALLGVYLIDAPKDELGLGEPLARGTAHLADTLELVCGLACGLIGGNIGLTRPGRLLAHPGIEHLDVRLGRKQSLVLVLSEPLSVVALAEPLSVVALEESTPSWNSAATAAAS